MPDTFDPDKYLAKKRAEDQQKGFDPDAYLSSAPTLAAEKPSVGASMLRGVNAGLAFGFYDEAIGALRAAGDKLSGSKEPFGNLYEKHRDEIRAWSKEAKSANPTAYMAGEVAGNIGTLALPGARVLAPTAKAGMAANIGKAALLGGTVAAGESDAPLASSQFIKDVATGAAVGGATQGAIGGVVKGAKFFSPSNLKRIAAERAVKTGTGQQVKAIRDLSKTGKLGVAGEDLLVSDEAGEPVVKWLSKTEDLVQRGSDGKLFGPVVDKKRFFGEKISEVADQIDELVPKAVSGDNIANNIINYAKSIPATPGNKTLLKRLAAEAQFFKDRENIGFGAAQRLKNSYKFKVTDPTTQHLGQDATNAVKSAIGSEMDEAAQRAKGQIGDSLKGARELIDRYELFKRKYGSFAAITKAAENRVEGNLSNRFISPSDYFMGGVGGVGSVFVTGEPFSGAALGAAGALLNKVARERGSAMVANGAFKLANILEKNPQVLGEFAPKIAAAAQGGAGALLLTHISLMHDPAYRRLIEVTTEPEPSGLQLPKAGSALKLPKK